MSYFPQHFDCNNSHDYFDTMQVASSHKINPTTIPPVFTEEELNPIVGRAVNEVAARIKTIEEEISNELDRIPKFSVKHRPLTKKERHHIHANRSREKRKRLQLRLTAFMNLLEEKGKKIENERRKAYQLCEQEHQERQLEIQPEIRSFASTSASSSDPDTRDEILPYPNHEEPHNTNEIVETSHDPYIDNNTPFNLCSIDFPPIFSE